MAKLTIEEIRSIVEACTYKPDWHIHLKDDGERLYIQIAATTLDSVTHEPCAWTSGKTYLSPFMCRQEIVGAVFGAIEKAEIHEIREFFRYRGASIYNPHIDPDVLVEVAKKKESFNVRDNAMSMVEETPVVKAKPDPTKDTFKFIMPDDIYTCTPMEGRERASISWTDEDGTNKTSYCCGTIALNIANGIWVVVG